MTDAKYRITHAEPRATFGPDRRPLDVYDVFFEVVEGGYVGQVSIPVNQFTTDKVAEAVQPLANALSALKQLGQ